MKRWKAVSLIIFGVVLCLVGVLLGSNFFPRSLLTRMETEMCVNSKGGTSYYRWVSFIFLSRSYVALKHVLYFLLRI